MNFLALAQRACIECGVASGTAIQTALPSVAGATGSIGRVVGWINDAWSDIQMDQDDWDWMRSSTLLGGGAAFGTVAGQASYPLGTVTPGSVGVAADAFGKWDRETIRCYPTAVGARGETYLDAVPFDTWRDGYMTGAMRSVQTRPVVVAVAPDQSLCLGPPPNGLYTVTADYFAAPSALLADADVPAGLPTRFHMLICYRAMAKAAQYESAPELYERAREEAGRLYAQLLAARAPRLTFGGALA